MSWDDCNWGYPQYRPYETALGSSKITVVLACLNGKKKRMNGMVACGMVLTTDWAYKNLHKVDDEVAHGARRDQSPFSNGFLAWCFSTHLTNMLGETMWNHCNQWNWLYGMAKDMTTLPIIPSSHIQQPYCWWTNFWEVWTMNYGTKYLPTYLCAGFCPRVISGNYKHITQVPNLRNSVRSCWQGYPYATFRDDGIKDANATST